MCSPGMLPVVSKDLEMIFKETILTHLLQKYGLVMGIQLVSNSPEKRLGVMVLERGLL